MSQDPQNPFTMWTDMNKNMFDAWNTWTSQMMPKTNDENDSEAPNFFNDYFVKPFAGNPMFTSMFSGENNMVGQMVNQWQDNMKSMAAFIPNQPVRDTFERFMNSYQMFNGLQSYWDTYLKNIPTNVTDWNDFSKKLLSQYQNLFGALYQPFMPDQLQSFFTMPMDNIPAMQQMFMDYYKPWIEDSSVMQGHLIKALQGDKDAHMEFIKAWSELYKNSYAKLLNIPAVGASRESIEKMQKLLDYYVSFTIKLNEYTMLISNLLTETMEKLIKNLMELQEEGKQPQTFLEFYKIWSSINEKAFEDLYATDAFAKIMNETVSVGSKFKMLFDDYLQDLLSFLPIPNRRELDSVEKEVYLLRNKVKALEKELKSVRADIDAKKAASKK